ncbi:MAG: hypothetical protein GX259_00450 [Bacteroidales bacterium]|nr:hypothetical protein [Bacteroidales bacterium]
MKVQRELPEILEIDFVICDNTLNRKRWRLLVEGIDFEGFLKNPVCVVQHDTWSIPVGKWKNLRVENSQFKGTVEFDKTDEQAVKLYWKYVDGYMNAVSLNILPKEESNADLVAGQIYPTISKSELLEISLVTVPGQKNAVKLSNVDGGDYTLSLISKTKNMNPEDKEKKENQSQQLQSQEQEIERLKSELAEQKKLNIDNLIESHKNRGVVADNEVESLKKLATNDYDTVKQMLEGREVKQNENSSKELSAQMAQFVKNNEQKAADERANWTYLDFYKKDPEALSLMQKNEPEKYAKLEKDFAEQAKKENLVY